jgi:hypothetical protein
LSDETGVTRQLKMVQYLLKFVAGKDTADLAKSQFAQPIFDNKENNYVGGVDDYASNVKEAYTKFGWESK